MEQLLLSTAYFPPIEYFYFLSINKSVLIEAHETYPKQTYRNRCNIYSPNGKQSLVIPVKKINGNHTKTSEIQISNHLNWRLHHWKSLQTAYNTSAFFMYYKDELWDCMQFQTNNLLEYNLHLLKFITAEIGLQTSISTTLQYISQKPTIHDLRTSISPKNKTSPLSCPEYFQVYSEKNGYLSNLSILDLLFNEGPNTLSYLQSIN